MVGTGGWVTVGGVGIGEVKGEGMGGGMGGGMGQLGEVTFMGLGDNVLD